MVDVGRWRLGVYGDKAKPVAAAEDIVKLHEENSGKSVLMLHGYAGYPGEFYSLIPLFFERGYDVFIPRLPGMGTSGDDFRSSDENDWLGLARNVLKTLEEEYSDIVLVSHSMGTFLSVLLSSNEKVSMQFLIAPAFSTSFGIGDEELEKLGTEDYERSIPWKSDDSYHLSYPGAPRDDEVLGREYWSHFYASDALAFTRLKKMALDVLESVTIPTYVYHGLKDETAPPDGLVETFSKVKGRVRIKIFDEGTHLLMYDRCRDVEKELIASIASVLDGRPAL